MIDFQPPAADAELAAQVRAFVRERIVPFERDPRNTAHGPTEALRRELNALAREAGLLAPQASREHGGRALTHRQQALVFEAAGYSPLGPVALHCAAPDEGNMHLLERAASPAQRERFLRPLAAGEVRSCFAMTEPAPGAGADPSLLATTARQAGDRFVAHGRKWLITGAPDAGFMILMCRTLLADGSDAGATMFLVPLPHEAVRIERLVDSIDSSFTAGHAEVAIDGLELAADDVLGELGQGFRYAQVRLAPARLTHCMRWLGGAARAHELACEFARQRTSFGRPLAEHQGVGFMLADNEMDLHVARLATWHAAWLLDTGADARHASSRAKVIVSEALWRVADRCVQVLGGLGLTGDTVVAQLFRELRAFRIYDGPSEVHRHAIARRIGRAQEA